MEDKEEKFWAGHCLFYIMLYKKTKKSKDQFEDLKRNLGSQNAVI